MKSVKNMQMKITSPYRTGLTMKSS